MCFRRLLTTIASILLLATLTQVAQATRPVRVYEVAIKGPESVAAIQDAMRQALVRATGRRNAGSDPALGTLVAEAPRFVLSRRPVTGGIQFVFDGPTIEREIANAGRTVWPRDRPFTLVVLDPPLSGNAADTMRRTLEEIAETRGLPVSLVPIALKDASGVELSSQAVMAAAQRMGADAVLIGRGESASLNGQWQWTLSSSFANESWTGPFDAGVHGAVDAFAKTQEDTVSLAEVDAVVEVEGVNSLTDYASVARLLGEVPGVRRTSLEETDRSSATFRLQVRGGTEVLERALENSARLVRSGGGGGRLIYQYRP